jgi:predicted RNA-binding protein with RPS1 domain
VVSGKVRNIANYGAFVEIEEGIDGLLHVSDLSWTKKIGHPSEILKKGEDVQAVVLSVDQEKQRIALGLKQMQEGPRGRRVIPALPPGHGRQGPRHEDRQLRRVRGAGGGLEGLLHISEISDQKVEKPEDVLKVGQEVDVKILRVDSDERKIGLSLKRAAWAQEEAVREEERKERQVKRGLRGGLGRRRAVDRSGRPENLAQTVRSSVFTSGNSMAAAHVWAAIFLRRPRTGRLVHDVWIEYPALRRYVARVNFLDGPAGARQQCAPVPPPRRANRCGTHFPSHLGVDRPSRPSKKSRLG